MQSNAFDFRSEVIEQSRSTPVLVDFWASWCAPCRMLTPVLERLAEKAGDRWKLVKVSTEEHPRLAEEYGVRGIPNVKLFKDGKVIDEFTGALPEHQIEQWLRKVLPSPYAEMVVRAAGEAAAGNRDAAQSLLDDVLKLEPGNLPAVAALARLRLYSNPAEAQRLIEHLEGEQEHADFCDAVRTLAPMLARPDADLPPGASRDAYASALDNLRQERFDDALEGFIGVLREDRQYDGDGSRQACIAIFRLLGEGHETTVKHRRAFDRAF